MYVFVCVCVCVWGGGGSIGCWILNFILSVYVCFVHPDGFRSVFVHKHFENR